MRPDDLRDLLDRSPFEPFRISLVNGDRHDISDPNTVSPLETSVFIAAFDGHWVLFAYDMVASVESLLEM